MISRVRESIFQTLHASGRPMSVPDLVGKIKVNKTSIYRQLENMLKNHEVAELEFGEGKKRYELTDKKHHHHVMCTLCHDTKCIALGSDLNSQEEEVSLKSNFVVTGHALEFFGVCKKCASSS